jgi:hypothetical protein
MSAVPDQQERSIAAVQSIFPGIPVYGSGAMETRNWVTMSHLGSAECGISLVGIGLQVGFGAADVVLKGNTSSSTSLVEAYDAALVAGYLKRATAGIVTCTGCLPDSCFSDSLVGKIGELPILIVACGHQASLLKPSPSIGIMLFGERHPTVIFENTSLSECACDAAEETASDSTAWPQSPATDISSTESTGSVDRCTSESEPEVECVLDPLLRRDV